MTRQITINLLNIIVIITAGNVAGCFYKQTGEPEEGKFMPDKTIEQVLQDNTDQWMAIDGVEGTAIGLSKGKPCIRIFTSVKPQQLQNKIPSAVESYPIIIEQTGSFSALE